MANREAHPRGWAGAPGFSCQGISALATNTLRDPQCLLILCKPQHDRRPGFGVCKPFSSAFSKQESQGELGTGHLTLRNERSAVELRTACSEKRLEHPPPGEEEALTHRSPNAISLLIVEEIEVQEGKTRSQVFSPSPTHRHTQAKSRPAPRPQGSLLTGTASWAFSLCVSAGPCAQKGPGLD